jgi:hypothetical protein
LPSALEPVVVAVVGATAGAVEVRSVTEVDMRFS